jgi:hypothetical protein
MIIMILKNHNNHKNQRSSFPNSGQFIPIVKIPTLHTNPPLISYNTKSTSHDPYRHHLPLAFLSPARKIVVGNSLPLVANNIDWLAPGGDMGCSFPSKCSRRPPE